MNNRKTNIEIPVGEAVFGRVVDHTGIPIDGMGPIEGTRISLTDKAVGGESGRAATRQFATGIKPIDLLLPVPLGGVIRWTTPWMVGSAVLMCELMRTMKFVHGGRTVMVAVEGRPRELDDLRLTFLESGIHDSVALILIPADAPLRDRRNGALAGLTLARNLVESEGRNVLFVVDRLALTEETVEAIRTVPGNDAAAMTTLVTSFAHDDVGHEEEQFEIDEDVEVVFAPHLAERGLYPAIDPFGSTSRMLRPESVGAEHVRVAETTRALLTMAHETRTNNSHQDSSNANAATLARAARLEQFLTQPFYVAQLYTAIPGEFVAPDETLRATARLLDGAYDHLPEEAFSYIGTMQVEEENGG